MPATSASSSARCPASLVWTTSPQSAQPARKVPTLSMVSASLTPAASTITPASIAVRDSTTTCLSLPQPPETALSAPQTLTASSATLSVLHSVVSVRTATLSTRLACVLSAPATAASASPLLPALPAVKAGSSVATLMKASASSVKVHAQPVSIIPLSACPAFQGSQESVQSASTILILTSTSPFQPVCQLSSRKSKT